LYSPKGQNQAKSQPNLRPTNKYGNTRDLSKRQEERASSKPLNFDSDFDDDCGSGADEEVELIL
jgi:hypothetical protein